MPTVRQFEGITNSLIFLAVESNNILGELEQHENFVFVAEQYGSLPKKPQKQTQNAYVSENEDAYLSSVIVDTLSKNQSLKTPIKYTLNNERTKADRREESALASAQKQLIKSRFASSNYIS